MNQLTTMSREVAYAYNYMTTDMLSKMGQYKLSLEHRYGDPRVYEAQREEMAAEQAVIRHQDSRSAEEALSAAYRKNRQQSTAQHKSRMVRFDPRLGSAN